MPANDEFAKNNLPLGAGCCWRQPLLHRPVRFTHTGDQRGLDREPDSAGALSSRLYRHRDDAIGLGGLADPPAS